MNIAIMACRKLVSKCSGSGCFKAYNNSEKAFDIYKDKNCELGSFFTVQDVMKQLHKMRIGVTKQINLKIIT